MSIFTNLHTHRISSRPTVKLIDSDRATILNGAGHFYRDPECLYVSRDCRGVCVLRVNSRNYTTHDGETQRDGNIAAQRQKTPQGMDGGWPRIAVSMMNFATRIYISWRNQWSGRTGRLRQEGNAFGRSQDAFLEIDKNKAVSCARIPTRLDEAAWNSSAYLDDFFKHME